MRVRNAEWSSQEVISLWPPSLQRSRINGMPPEMRACVRAAQCPPEYSVKLSSVKAAETAGHLPNHCHQFQCSSIMVSCWESLRRPQHNGVTVEEMAACPSETGLLCQQQNRACIESQPPRSRGQAEQAMMNARASDERQPLAHQPPPEVSQAQRVTAYGLQNQQHLPALQSPDSAVSLHNECSPCLLPNVSKRSDLPSSPESLPPLWPLRPAMAWVRQRMNVKCTDAYLPSRITQSGDINDLQRNGFHSPNNRGEKCTILQQASR